MVLSTPLSGRSRHSARYLLNARRSAASVPPATSHPRPGTGAEPDGAMRSDVRIATQARQLWTASIPRALTPRASGQFRKTRAVVLKPRHFSNSLGRSWPIVTGLRAPEFRLINLLQSEEATLPKSFAESEDYRTRLESALAVYQAKLQSLTAPDEMSDAVRKAIPAMAELSAALLNALDAMLKGNGRTAHDLFRSAMSNAVIKGAVETLSSQELARKQIKTLYRMRSVTALESLPRGAMFHIPFH